MWQRRPHHPQFGQESAELDEALLPPAFQRFLEVHR
jgi:hypothetical protein